MKNQTHIYKAIKILAVLGIMLSVYLLWQQLYRPPFQPCYVNSLINCDAVVTGPVAKTFGVSTPLYGLIGYVVILAAVFLKMNKLLLGMASFGLIFCLSIAYIELFQLKVICPVCIACQIIMLTIFSLAVATLKNQNRKEVPDAKKVLE